MHFTRQLQVTTNAPLSQALAFCDQRGSRETHLWTVQGLDAARRLYESHGFRLAEEYLGDQWGSEILEQRFVRQLRRQTRPSAARVTEKTAGSA